MMDGINRGGEFTQNLAASAHRMQRITPGGKENADEAFSFKNLLSNKILAALPGSDFAELTGLLEPVSLSQNESLYELEQPVEFAYFPESAVVSYHCLLQDGNAIEAGMVGNEGVVGLAALFGQERATQWSRTVVAGSVLRVRVNSLKQRFDGGGMLRGLLLDYVNAYVNQLSQRATCNIRHTVKERLATWLMMIQDRSDGGELALTHEMMASHLGTRRAGVTMIACDLQSQGIIKYNRGRISILDRARLEAAACECYRAINKTS
jgi:CRP-like cAMP-binding protein